ncbi:MAG: glycosyltransferase family 4 protein [Bryobacteraceae bacterium]|nr:glycosyltransferase family 4 protein [Bryobacteraceae bacterium]
MRIALDATPLSVATGGVARYTAELSRALAEEFPEDQFWLLSDQPFPSPSPSLHVGERPGGIAGKRWWLWGLPREASRLDIDVFHGTDFAVPYLPLRPSVATVHDLSPWRFPEWQPDAARVRSRTPILLKTKIATLVITPTEAIRREVLERFALPPDRVRAVHLAAAARFRPETGAPPPRPYFLYVGTVEPRKNLKVAIEAWREVRRSHDIDLVIAGRLRQDAGPLPRHPGLIVRGPVAEGELPRLYSHARAVLYPSVYEGFGLPVLEAMQCGAVVLTSRDPALTEVAAGAAIQLDPQNAAQWVEAMSAVATGELARAEFQQRGIRRAAQFSWRKAARETREIYEEARRRFRR